MNVAGNLSKGVPKLARHGGPGRWVRYAACRGHDLNLWFRDEHATTTYSEARAICAGCPVSAECLAWAPIARPDEIWCPYVDAGPVREHVEWLRDCGIGLRTLAKLAGVSHGALSKLMYGDPARHMPPSQRVRPATARKVMAVMPHHAAGAQRVPAAPTWRLLNELIALGWSRGELARRLGRQGPGLQIRKDRVLASTARQVEQLHAELIQVRVIPKKTRWGVRPTPANLSAVLQ